MPQTEDFCICENVPLAPYTTWKIGGSARYFCEARPENLAAVLKWAKQNSKPFCVIGGGSNILIPSEGIEGLVIRLSRKDAFFRTNGSEAEVSAGMPLGRFLSLMASQHAAGFDFLAGIPGTVGGAVFMNAGTGGDQKREIADVIKSAKIIMPDGSEKTFTRDEMEFGHRSSVFQKNGAIIRSAVFDISVSEPKEKIDEKIKARIQERSLREPSNNKNAGSVFKSADGIPAAVFIDRAGLKGLRLGDAMVSLKHANWIENMGAATSDDVLLLIEEVRRRIFDKFSVRLETEVRILKAK